MQSYSLRRKEILRQHFVVSFLTADRSLSQLLQTWEIIKFLYLTL